MKRKARRYLGLAFFALAGLGVVWGVTQPMPYVIISPGPAYNVISELEGSVLITVSGVPLADNPGTLDMLTVSIGGTPQSQPGALDVVGAYLSSDQSVEPMEEFYPYDENLDEVIRADRKDFTDSIDSAIYVAKKHLAPEISQAMKVDVNLEDVGGPSAGMMLTLGIIDKASPESLTGGKYIAGTGTIDQRGNVGAIGGIRFKLISAQRAGDKFFLAPKENCSEVVGNIPRGLKVFAVGNIDDALKILNVIASDGNLGKLPVCTDQ
ncbi:MAG: S16 family serine protease [Micrococcales bacterium]